MAAVESIPSSCSRVEGRPFESCDAVPPRPASSNVDRGVFTENLMKLGDWRSYAMVLKYAHLCPDKLAEAANLVTRKGHTNRKKHVARR